MLFHSKMHAPIWVIVFVLVALTGSGTIVGPDLAWLVLRGLALGAPVILFAVVSMLWKGFGSRGSCGGHKRGVARDWYLYGIEEDSKTHSTHPREIAMCKRGLPDSPEGTLHIVG